MCCAPAVAAEISEPPTTPRGISRSAPGLTTLMGRVYPRGQLDLKWRLGRRVVIDLQRRVVDVEAFFEKILQRASPGMTVIPGVYDDVRRERRKPGGDLPDVEVMNLDDAGLRREGMTDLPRVDSRRRRLHEAAARRHQQAEGGVQHQPCDHQ